MTTWWDRATREQRLAQIDGAIECGMTARQFLAAIGEINASTQRIDCVGKFAAYRGRSFNGKSFNQTRILSVKARREHHHEEIEIPGAFSIFGGTESSNNLFNAHPND